MCSKVEKLRAGAEEFLDKALGSDASLIFSPSQVCPHSLIVSYRAPYKRGYRGKFKDFFLISQQKHML